MDTSFASSHHSVIEPLEQRIAPALLVNGANLLGGGDNPTTGETSIGDNALTLVKVLSGQALVWFDATTRNITGISVGANTSLDITGNVYGDIVANLAANGHLSDSDNDPSNGEDGNVLLANNIVGVKTRPLSSENGDVAHIITGGSVSNLSINGRIEGIYAGDSVFRTGSAIAADDGADRTFSVSTLLEINPVDFTAQTSFTFLKSDAQFQAGAFVKNGTIQTASGLQIFSGSGASSANNTAAGTAGGNIENITIATALAGASGTSYELLAGNGGSGKSGGAGGSINKIIEKTSGALVTITAGDGGSGTTGAGGAGGSVKLLDLQSDSTSYTVRAGKGGNGTGGGAGGALVNNNFSGKNPSTGIILDADFNGDDVEDLLVVDSSTGNMTVSLNEDNGTTFTLVIQDDKDASTPNTSFITPQGTTPSSVAAGDVNNDGKLDLIVSYRNSNELAVYFNDGKGNFLATAPVTIALDASPAKVVAGNFSGSAATDLAVLVTSNAETRVLVVEGDGAGKFTVLNASTEIETARIATDMIAAQVNANSYDDLFVSFAGSGGVQTLLSTGSADEPFTVKNNGLGLIRGSVSNLDVDGDARTLLALAADTKTLSLFTYASDGSLTPILSPDLTKLTTKPIVAHFVEDNDALTANHIAVLSLATSGSQIDEFAIDTTAGAYASAATVRSATTLKNFVILDGDSDNGVAALGGSLSRFFFSQSLGEFAEFGLPFAGKTVTLFGGDGGAGSGSGKGGAGGAITAQNIEAMEAVVTAGKGGNSVNGAAGAGGAITNPTALVTAGGVSLIPKIASEQTLLIHSGDGGSATGSGKLAVGGNGGNVTGMILTLLSGDINVTTGDGGNGNGGNGGNAGNITSLQTTTKDGNVTLALGKGGNALGATGKGGSGGSATGFKHVLDLDTATEDLEKAYAVTINGGTGGNSTGAVGGAGGSINQVELTLDPSNVDPATGLDNTVHIALNGGRGGNGTTGGSGGSISGVKETTVLDQVLDGGLRANSVTMEMKAGDGGKGTIAAGGNGGSVSNASLRGLTFYDFDSVDNTKPSLIIEGGLGGDGATIGGAGGVVTAITSSNTVGPNGDVLNVTHLTSAVIVGGDGGLGGSVSGGRGGDVTNFNIGVQRRAFGGSLFVTSGNGGDSTTGIGGAAGNVTSGQVGSVGGDVLAGYGVFLATGDGGDGAKAGGSGGSISSVKMNSPFQSTVPTAFLVAGDGGTASGANARGGNGGSITSVSQTKDLNSAIDLIQAGNGGASTGTGGIGGNGGSVSQIQTVGFIGKPASSNANLGVFTNGFAQGLFAGRGGAGATSGIAGSISSIVARQIAAIGAAVDANGLFGLASKVANITADVIGFEVNRDGKFENLTGINQTSPTAALAVDGFILAAAMNNVKTLNNARTTQFTFTA